MGSFRNDSAWFCVKASTYQTVTEGRVMEIRFYLKLLLFWRVLPSIGAFGFQTQKGYAFLEGFALTWSFGVHGHVRFPTFHETSHVSDLEMTFSHNFPMILHSFVSRKLETTVVPSRKRYIQIKSGPGPETYPKIT